MGGFLNNIPFGFEWEVESHLSNEATLSPVALMDLFTVQIAVSIFALSWHLFFKRRNTEKQHNQPAL